jgi:hypothetical protein
MAIDNIDVESLTNEFGTGVFDKLMVAVNNNILTQYNDGRITNADYASVYLGSLQAVLAQSVQFALQAELAEEQARTAYTDRIIKDKQAAKLGLDNVMKNSESARDADDNFVYTPIYEKQ